MNVLLIGSGGREHAIAKKLSESRKLKNLYAIPGNPGIAQIAKVIDDQMDVPAIIRNAKNNQVDLIVCGPEKPLVEGLFDEAKKENITVFGPSRKGALLEGSKIFSKQFMQKYNIPTANFRVFQVYSEAVHYLQNKLTFPTVIKADGLAAGKGVKIAQTRDEALEITKEYMVDKILGPAGEKIVIEDFMIGEEMSAFYITDGHTFTPLIAAKDYKRALDGDQGENTGGMGCYAPHTALNDSLRERIENDIIKMIKFGFKNEQIIYKGILYIGLMLTSRGPKVVEFNCRFGDPEAQVLLPLIDSDLLEIFSLTTKGAMHSKPIKWKTDYCACVVLASGGYPGPYQKGVKIDFDGIEPFDLIHAGTRFEGDDIVTNGGRVLNAIAFGSSKTAAINAAYKIVSKVKFDGCFYRNDIGV